MTEMLQASDEAAALEALHDAGTTDGLPVSFPLASGSAAWCWPADRMLT